MLPLALDPIGIGATWTGVVIGAVGLVVVSFVYFAIWDWRDTRRSNEEDTTERDYYGNAAAARGTLLCDWVDDELLRTVARQQGVPLEPTRIERGEGSVSSFGGQASPPGGFLARFGKERRSDHRAYYDVSQDSNALLRDVLKALIEKGSLTVELDALYAAGIPFGFDDRYLDEFIRTAKGAPELDEARNALRALADSHAREGLSARWRSFAEDLRFTLVDSAWEVSGTGDALSLRLAKVRRFDTSATPAGGRYDTVETPPGLNMTLALDRSFLTTQGRARLIPGSQVKAAAFATIGAFDEAANELRLSPVAVFARIESYDA